MLSFKQDSALRHYFLKPFSRINGEGFFLLKRDALKRIIRECGPRCGLGGVFLHENRLISVRALFSFCYFAEE